MATDVVESELRLRAGEAIQEMNKLTKSANDFSTQLQDILTHLDNINKKSLANINKQINNIDLNSMDHVVSGKQGTIANNGGITKAQRQYEQALIDEANEITKDVAQRRKLRKQRADAETTKAKAEQQRVSKMEDRSSQQWMDTQEKFAQAKLLNAQNNQTGALRRNWRYQTAGALGTVGSKMESTNAIGRIAGGILDTFSRYLISPAAGARATIEKLGGAIVDLGKESVKAYSEIEATKTQLGVVFSNQSQANSMFGDISQYAIRSPFGIQQTSELAVLLKQSGVYASDLMDTLKMLGDTAGGNMEKMKRIANNYAQIVSIGKASMLDMRQFAYAGIPIFEAVSKELNVSQQELRKLISDGKVTSDIIEKVFKDLTGINGIFENATEKGAKTLKARLQNLSDAGQLALASIGQNITSYGTQTGNDSYVNTVVSLLEQLYQDVHDKVDTRNIEKSVKAIENREARITELQNILDKYSDNPKMLALFTQAIGVELSKRSKETDRAAYEASYQNKTKISEKTYKDFGVKNYQELENLAKIVSQSGLATYKQLKAKSLTNPLIAAEKSQLESKAEKYGLDLKELYNMPRGEFDTLAKAIADAVEVVKKANTLTETEIKYHLETNTLAAQQLAFDQQSKRANETGSLNSKFQELLEVYKASDEYKQKEEEERIKTLTEAKELLIKLKTKADDTGSLDFTKFSMGEFLKYNAQGAFSTGRKLQVVNGDGTPNSEDMAILKKQFGYAMSESMKSVQFTDRNTYNLLTQEMSKLNANLNDTDYLEQFSDTLNSVENIVKNAKLPEAVKNQLLGFIGASTYTHELTVGGENADLSALGKTNGSEFVPLWKRILAGATGLSTQGMTSTLQTMKNYRDDMAIRNMASGVLTATMRSVGMDSAMSLVKTAGNAKELRGDKGGTYQVDWKATQKAIKEFSLSLSASTEVISAYKKGLEEELETYEKLVAAGFTEGESQDLKNQKTVSTKTLEKLSKDAGDQLVNAFGEGLATKSGKKAFFNGTDFIDEEGNKLQEEEIIMTGNLFDFIKSVLPKIYNELHEANEAELNNKLLGEMFDKIAPTLYQTRFAQNNGYGVNTSLLYQNPNYASSFLNTKMTALKSKSGYDSIKMYDNTDIVIKAIQNDEATIKELKARIEELKKLLKNTPEKINGKRNNEYDKVTNELGELEDKLQDITDSSKLLNEVFRAMDQNLTKLTSSDDFKAIMELLSTLSRDNAVMQAYMESKQFSEYGLKDPTNIKPENYGGSRGFNARMYKWFSGNELAYDKEDYNKLLWADKETRNNINSGRAAINAKRRMEDKEELPYLSSEDFEKSNKEIMKMLTFTEKLGLAWQKSGEDILTSLDNIAVGMGDILRDFTASAITTTFETWGKTLATAADDADEIGKNLAQMSASMLKNMGSMITQAGLSLAISSIGDKSKVLAGLAIAAAGGGLSMMGGFIDGKLEEDSSKENNEYQKLLQIKQDLSELLKQAREDAIYYENTVRHRKAITANDNFVKSVHDAIITPRGDVVTTDPKDYLIATKTPRTLVGGGAPTINFSVIDKSTGIKVTQQRSTYNDATNTIEFEAIIESKIQEVIATSKGDEAFAARQSRLNGKTVIA